MRRCFHVWSALRWTGVANVMSWLSHVKSYKMVTLRDARMSVSSAVTESDSASSDAPSQGFGLRAAAMPAT